MNSLRLHPYHVTGLVDGEGYFTIHLRTNNNRRGQNLYEPRFGLALRADDRDIVFSIREFFGVGNTMYSARDFVKDKGSPQWLYYVQGTKACKILVGHFDKYPLQSKKRRDYEIWREFIFLPKGPTEYKKELKARLQQVKKFEGHVEMPVLEDAQTILFEQRPGDLRAIE